MENDSINVINKLVKLFYKGSLNFNLSVDEVEKLTWSAQEELIRLTVNSDIFMKYPIRNEYCKLYFKKLINLLENYQEIYDGIYEIMCTSMSNKSTNNSFCYQHYIVDNNLCKVVTMRETKSMVVNGTTGMKTWEAALILADWMLCNKHLFKNKNILELGSGLGFTGIVLTKFCDVISMNLTDCHEDVLQTICNNVKINFPNSMQNKRNDIVEYHINDKVLRVGKLDWNFPDKCSIKQVPDIIIGADIIYDPSLLEPLCDVVQLFYNKNKSICVYIACVIRNERTFEQFLHNLELRSMEFEKIVFRENVHLDWKLDTDTYIVKIKSMV